MTDAKTIRVLVLDDSVHDAELILLHLRQAGYTPESKRISTAKDLRDSLKTETWDVIVSDFAMPQFDALDALSIIKEHDIDVPFIVVSGSVGETAAVEAMKQGAHDFFLKDNLARLGAAVARERTEAGIRRERKRALQELEESREHLRQAVAARDEFLSIASHELKTPLTSLTLNVQSARDILNRASQPTPILDKLRGKFDSAARQAKRLAALVNNLLEVTRITSGKLTLSRAAMDLGEVVSSVASDLKEMLRASGSELRVSASVPVVGQWDRVGMEAVVFNIVGNAIKYGGGKPIDVEVSVDQRDARVVVTDRGIGIPPHDQERIFDRFERAVPREHFGGMGLGLWIARHIVEAHGGTIAVASKPQRGSTFTVRIPLTAAEERPS